MGKSLLLTFLKEYISISTLHSLKFSWKIISRKFEEKKSLFHIMEIHFMQKCSICATGDNIVGE